MATAAAAGAASSGSLDSVPLGGESRAPESPAGTPRLRADEIRPGPQANAVTVLALLDRLLGMLEGVQEAQRRLEERQRDTEGVVRSVAGELSRMARSGQSTDGAVAKVLAKARTVSANVKDVRERLERQAAQVRKLDAKHGDLLRRNNFRILIFQEGSETPTAEATSRPVGPSPGPAVLVSDEARGPADSSFEEVCIAGEGSDAGDEAAARPPDLSSDEEYILEEVETTTTRLKKSSMKRMDSLKKAFSKESFEKKMNKFVSPERREKIKKSLTPNHQKSSGSKLGAFKVPPLKFNVKKVRSEDGGGTPNEEEAAAEEEEADASVAVTNEDSPAIYGGGDTDSAHGAVQYAEIVFADKTPARQAAALASPAGKAVVAAVAAAAPPPRSPGAGRAGSPAVQSLSDSQAQNWPHYGGKTLHPLSMQQQQQLVQQQQQQLVQQHLAQQQQLQQQQQQQHQLFQKSPLANLLSQIANLHHQQQQHPLHYQQQQQVDKSAGRMKTYGTRLGVTEPPCDSPSRPCVWESAYGLSGQWGVPLQPGSGQPGHGGMKQPSSMDMDTYDVRAMESERETLVGASTNAVGGGGGRPDFCQAPGAPVVKTNFMGGRMRQDQSPERHGMPAPFPTSFGGGGSGGGGGGGGTAFTMHTVFSEPYGKRGEGGMGLTSSSTSCSSSASSSCRPSLLSDISRPYTLFDSNSWSPAFGNSEHSTPASQSPQSSQPSSPPPPSSMFGPIGTLDPTDRRATTSTTADRWNGKRPEKPGAASGYGLDYLPSDATWPPPPRVLPSQALHATSRGGGAAPWMGAQHASEPPPSLADNLKSLWSNSVMQPGPLALEQLLMQQKQKQFNLGQSNPPH